jgi:predicted transcriptional regulator
MSKNQIELRLSKNLRSLIKERGMTVVALSRKTGTPLQTLHGWLAGVEPRGVRQIKLVAGYFGLSLDELCFQEIKE